MSEEVLEKPKRGRKLGFKMKIKRGKHPNSRKALRKSDAGFKKGEELTALQSKIGVMTKKIKKLENKRIRDQLNCALDIAGKRVLKMINEQLKTETRPSAIEDLKMKRDILNDGGLEALKVIEIVLSPKTKTGERLEAVKMLYDRREGKPKQSTGFIDDDGDILQPPVIHFMGVMPAPFVPRDVTPKNKVIEFDEE